jgi:hypothetical protein
VSVKRAASFLVLLFAWRVAVADEYSGRAFLVLIGGLLLNEYLGVARRWTGASLIEKAGFVGGWLAILAAFPFWSVIERNAPSATRSLVAATSRAWLWIALLVALWGYGAASRLILMRRQIQMADVIEKDMIPFRRALERYVMPRRLNPSQLSQITQHLRANPQSEVHLRSELFDSEADNLRAQVQSAIDAGAWRIIFDPPERGLRPGMFLEFEQTPETEQRLRDRREFSPLRVLQGAFDLAQVQLDGSGSSGGARITEDKLTLFIGPRPHGRLQSWTD